MDRQLANRVLLVCVLLLSSGLTASCRSIYYDAMETLGQHKRDLLVDRVADARDEQEEAKEQFQSALEKFTSLVGAPNTELQALYDDLSRELERSESKADAVRDRIESIETVSEDLFAEWETELEQYSSEEFRQKSRDNLERARSRYRQMIAAMKRPERKMDEVLVAFRDHVLFLKHNLNAQAVALLQGTVDALEIDTAELIGEMEAAIAEADAFIRSMDEPIAG